MISPFQTTDGIPPVNGVPWRNSELEPDYGNWIFQQPKWPLQKVSKPTNFTPVNDDIRPNVSRPSPIVPSTSQNPVPRHLNKAHKKTTSAMISRKIFLPSSSESDSTSQAQSAILTPRFIRSNNGGSPDEGEELFNDRRRYYLEAQNEGKTEKPPIPLRQHDIKRQQNEKNGTSPHPKGLTRYY